MIAMPSKSAAQHRIMEIVAHGGTAKAAPSLTPGVAKEFVAADKGKRFARIKTMSQANSGGSKRTHTTQMPGHASGGAYSMQRRGAK